MLLLTPSMPHTSYLVRSIGVISLDVLKNVSKRNAISEQLQLTNSCSSHITRDGRSVGRSVSQSVSPSVLMSSPSWDSWLLFNL